MNPGPWFPEPDRRRNSEPPESDYDEGDEGSFADVYNSFSFGSGRGRRKKRKRDEEPQPEQHSQEEGLRADQRERAREAFRTPPPYAGPSESERSASDLPVQGQSRQSYPAPGLPVPGQPAAPGSQVPGQQIPEQQGTGQDFGGSGPQERQIGRAHV